MLVELLLLVALFFLLWRFFKKTDGMPPGRWGLPLIGYIPLTRKRIHDQLFDLHKKYGDIYVWRFGTQVIVILHDYQLNKDAFASQDFIDRPPWNFFRYGEETASGVIASGGSLWHNNRRFVLRQLRDLGMGKSRMVAAVQWQGTQLVQQLKNQAGRPAPLPHALEVAIVNVIWQMVAGKQFEMSDSRLMELQNLLRWILESTVSVAIPDFFPWLLYILPGALSRRVFNLDRQKTTLHKFQKYFTKEIEEHRATLDRDNPRDLIDGYLMMMEEKADDPDNTFNAKDLAILVLDLFFAGSETTTITLTWMFYYLATYPEVQQKMQAEIDEVLPKGTLATLDDKLRMPYTEAVIHETLRKSSLAATGVQHVATRDTQLGGYYIPKGTVVIGAQETIHHDPRYWNRPDEFLPERWLDQQGKFTPKKEGFLPFGVGKRSCLGEALARMELFIISTTVFQSLTFSQPPGKRIDLHYNPKLFLTHHPKIQDVLITVRPGF
ncbi:cytochrome P450 2L1-like [Homarus americanus]|uniref:cytochrome P450 2L1-like n=1 Tax=Homarus americanus TaxID=6706 RepID=UPI001C444F9F|nr:cytochrome P450 2L1-like [Homarus americanus]